MKCVLTKMFYLAGWWITTNLWLRKVVSVTVNKKNTRNKTEWTFPLWFRSENHSQRWKCSPANNLPLPHSIQTPSFPMSLSPSHSLSLLGVLYSMGVRRRLGKSHKSVCVSKMTERDRLFITASRAESVYTNTHTHVHTNKRVHPLPRPWSWLNTINPPSHHAWRWEQRWESLTWWHTVWHHSHNTHILN